MNDRAEALADYVGKLREELEKKSRDLDSAKREIELLKVQKSEVAIAALSVAGERDDALLQLEEARRNCLRFRDWTMAPSKDFAQGAEWAALDILNRLNGGKGIGYLSYLTDAEDARKTATIRSVSGLLMDEAVDRCEAKASTGQRCTKEKNHRGTHLASVRVGSPDEIVW